MASVLKTAIVADNSNLIDGEPADAADVSVATNSNRDSIREGRVAVTAADLYVKNLDDAISVGSSMSKTVTAAGADEGLSIDVSSKLAALNALLPASGKIQDSAIDSETATSSYVLTANGSGGSTWAAAGGGGAAPVDLTVTAAEALSERDVVYVDMSAGTAYKLDADAVGAIKAGRIRGIVNEVGGIAAAASGSVRIIGEVSGFTGLTAWADVFASTTAGGYTQTKPTVTAGGGQVAIMRLGYATSTSAIMVWPRLAEWLKRESLANDASLTIEHYTDGLGRNRTVRGYISATDTGTALTEYVAGNRDESVWLRGGSGAGGTLTATSGTTGDQVIGKNPSNIRRDRLQTFTPSAGKLTQITVNLAANLGAPTGTIEWSVCADDAGGSEPGTVLASGTFTPTPSATNTITVTDGPFLDGSSTYWLWLLATDFATFSANVGYMWKSSLASVITGSRWYYDGTTYTLVDTTDQLFSVTTDAEVVKDTLAQSFQLASGEVVSKVGLYLKKLGAPTGTMTCRIETDSAGSPSGTLADVSATTTVAESMVGTSYAEIEFDFATDFSLSGSTTYWIVLSTSRTASSSNYVAWGDDESAPSYASGEMKGESSSTWSALSADAIFAVYPADTVFEEPAVVGRYSGGTRDIGVRYDDGAGADSSTKTTFKNVSGATLDVTCVVELD